MPFTRILTISLYSDQTIILKEEILTILHQIERNAKMKGLMNLIVTEKAEIDFDIASTTIRGELIECTEKKLHKRSR